ncbi:MAG: carboxypeptidase regulatory-like domain-containing protein [Bacteroidales bacterium]|nr:carboxypeptidase regulatory-like domain-containing protein [Bacteroidales bacterium]
MKRKFLLLVMMCLLGGFSSSLMAQEVTIGANGTTESSTYPYISTSVYSTSQQIYKASEITDNGGGAGTISKISFYVSDPDVNKTVYDVKIYIKHTTKDAFSSKPDWDKTVKDPDHLVFSGNATITNSVLEIPLTTSTFEYDGKQNLLVCFDVNSKQGAATYYRTYSADSRRVMYYRNTGTNYGPDAPKYYDQQAYATPSNGLPMITLTFGGAAEKKAPVFTDNQAYPNGEYATSIFNPYLSFYAENKTHYKVLLSTTEDFSSDVRYVAGSETEWVNDETKQIYTSTVEGLNYAQPTTYYWKVIANNGGGADDPTKESTVYSFTTKQISAPGAIENAYPNGDQDLVNPKFTWTFGTDTEEYQVLIDGVAVTEWTNPGSSTTGEYQTSDLSSGNHTWRIDARNSVNTTKGIEYTFSVASVPDNVTPVSPIDGATGVTSNIVTFKFDPNTTHYKLMMSDTNENEMFYISIKNGGTGNNWTSTNGVKEMSFAMPFFTTGKTFYWAVEVMNSVGPRTETAIYSFTTASTLPSTYAYPANGSIASEVNPALSWNYVGNAAFYQVLLGTSKTNLEIVQDWTARGTNDQFQTSDLNAASEYYWQVNVKETENGEVLYGDIVSFITKLEIPQNVSANPEEVEPSLGQYGSTQIMWNSIKGATSYNVYLDGKKIADTTANNYTVKAKDLKIKSNMNPGYNFTVTAVYEGYGESGVSEAVNVKVANIGMLIVYVKDPNNNPIEGASIELSGISEFGKEKTYTILSDATGKGSKSILVADYAMTISKDNYSSHSKESVKIEKGDEKILNVTLASEYIYNVTAEETETNGNIKITLTGKEEGYYNVYLKTNEGEELIKENAWFSGFGSAQYVYESWNTLNNGTYQFGVANYNSNIINWSNEITRDYAIFNTDGDWNTASNWKEGLPQADDNVLIYANATIAATDVITVGTVDIKAGSLTINGSLTADKVYNKNESALCIKDGGQLFQNNAELSGQFVMNIRNDWSASNKGWQLISSPFVDATTASFESTDGDFDLYKYDGSKEGAEWVNYKNTGDNSGEQPEQPGGDDLTASSFYFDFEDGSMTGWRTFSGEGNTAPAWAVSTVSDYYGNGPALYSMSYNANTWTTYIANNYVVTENAYKITAESKLSWYVNHSFPNVARDDIYEVVISEDNENFTQIWRGTYQRVHQMEISLAEYAGKKLYIGFRHECTNDMGGDAIIIDDIALTSGSKTRSSNTRSFDETFVQGVGYLASYEKQETATLTGTFYSETSFVAYPELSYTKGKDLANTYLLGNPFTFDMDMSRASFTNLVNGIAVVTEEGGYDYTQTTIPVGDGFFVQTIGEGAEFSYDHKNVPAETRSGRQANSINVIATGKAGKDNAVINFAGQSEGFSKLQNLNEEIATVFVSNNGKRYGIANVDENVAEVELSFVASQMGNYSISLDINGEFENVILVDRFTGIETNMLLEDEYNFTATSNDSHNRFVVKLDNRQQTTDNSQFVYQSGEELIINAEGTIQIIDMMGRVVYSNEMNNGRINVSDFNNAAYVVRVVNAEGVKSQKVVIY